MKKTLLIGSALVIGFAGYSQSNAKKAINPKYLQKTLHVGKRVVAEGQSTSNSNINWQPTVLRTSSACLTGLHVSDSWNPNGVGAGEDCPAQNNLVYNKDLNAMAWIMRASCDWSAVFPTSGGYEATIIQNVTSSPSSTVVPNTIDTVALFADSSLNNVGGRFPGGSWLNPAGNTDWHKAYACVMGPYNKGATGNWLGSVYVAKPLWSTSAMTHTILTKDSLHQKSPAGPFGSDAGNAVDFGVPNIDAQQVGNTMWSIGHCVDNSIPTTAAAPAQPYHKAFLSKATITAPGVVSWSVDSTSLTPNLYRTATLGYLVSGPPRLAFGPDGQHGYALFLGRSATTYSNSADSSMTPILYQTTDGGTTWTQKLAGYDWACKHPEVMKNVGMLTGPKTYYSFSPGYYGADLVVDANNMLHYVTFVAEPYHGKTYSLAADSMAIYTYSYDYDNIHYHPIIWDFMTDGNDWTTMMVDSLQSSQCNGTSTDTSSAYSAWTSVSPDFLTVSSHLTVSRTPDGSKVFYGWADTPAGTTGFTNNQGQTINPNTNPDIFVKGYDAMTKMTTVTTDITPGLGYCFFPYLSDMAYYDSNQSAWVTPAVYTVGRSSSVASAGFTQYNGNGTTPATGVNYFYTNCSAFHQSDFSVDATINIPVSGTVCASYPSVTDIKSVNNSFASSISNFPNPFDNTTTIAVTLTESKAVDIKVYNTMGALVFSKKVDGNIGQNNVTFDGGQLSSGVYYYTVTAGNQQATKKMVIQK